MKDEIIYEALKQSIIVAFFQPQTYWKDGYQQTYGGLAQELVSKLLNEQSIRDLISKVVDEIKDKHKAKIQDLLLTKSQEAIGKEVEKYVQGGNYYFEDWLKTAIKEIALPKIKEELVNSKALAEKIKAQVDVAGYDLQINVSVNVVKKV